MHSLGDPSDREYDPPWLPHTNDTSAHAVLHHLDRPSSEIILELGSGMGVVGFASAASLYRYMRSTGNMIDSGGTSGVETNIRSAQVILTDLPEVCTLLQENVGIQVDQWRAAGLDGILCECRDGVDQPECDILRLERASETDAHHVERHSAVTLKVRSLPWGKDNPAQDLSTELKSCYHVETKRKHVRLTIICSDLVRTICIGSLFLVSKADGIDFMARGHFFSLI